MTGYSTECLESWSGHADRRWVWRQGGRRPWLSSRPDRALRCPHRRIQGSWCRCWCTSARPGSLWATCLWEWKSQGRRPTMGSVSKEPGWAWSAWRFSSGAKEHFTGLQGGAHPGCECTCARWIRTLAQPMEISTFRGKTWKFWKAPRNCQTGKSAWAPRVGCGSGKEASRPCREWKAVRRGSRQSRFSGSIRPASGARSHGGGGSRPEAGRSRVSDPERPRRRRSARCEKDDKWRKRVDPSSGADTSSARARGGGRPAEPRGRDPNARGSEINIKSEARDSASGFQCNEAEEAASRRPKGRSEDYGHSPWLSWQK